MATDFNLERYLTNGVENMIKGVIKASLTNPKESIFMTKYSISSKAASKLRKHAEENGEHIPPFLIASITSSCNLHCEGCYARANHSCTDKEEEQQLTEEEWLKIFNEAKEIGVGFILLAGGEPLIRKDIIKKAGTISEILFPVFTNGTMIDEDYLNIFDKHRNLIPILSIEGREEKTDQRRGDGVYRKLILSMESLKKNKILFGASVTVTTENLEEVSSKEYIEAISENGCKGVIYVEYVPVTKESKNLALGDKEREYLNKRLINLRETHQNLLFISFPGDEKSSGGCLAAGRGFFHINGDGGVEPCPFSPYSDTNIKTCTVLEALQSPLFFKLNQTGILLGEHDGGCLLFEKENEVKQMLV